MQQLATPVDMVNAGYHKQVWMQVEGMERLEFERKGSMLVSDLRQTYLPKIPLAFTTYLHAI